MWAARDKDGDLWVYEMKPERFYDYWDNLDDDSMKCDRNNLPDLKWEDEPIKVDVVAKEA